MALGVTGGDATNTQQHPLLEVTGLSLRIGPEVILENVRAQIQAGERVGLGGPSGSGKSLLAASLLGLQPEVVAVAGDAYLTVPGKPRVNLIATDSQGLRRVRGGQIGLIFQEPSSALNPVHRVGEQVREAVVMLNPNVPRAGIEPRVRELFATVQLGGADYERIRNSYPHELSGGQRQRVVIAIALAGNPYLLIADEPTTALDAETETEVFTLIDRLIIKRGMSLLLISHDRTLLGRWTDRTLRINDKRIVEGDREDNTEPRGTTGTDRPTVSTGDEILTIRGLRVGYEQRSWLPFRQAPREPVLRGLNLSLHRHEWVGLVGQSGAGKTSLARAITGLIPATFDVLEYEGARPQLIPQDPAGSLNPRHTVRRILREVLRAQSWPKKKRDTRVDELLTMVRLNPDLHRRRLPHELSGGQRQRVAIARALAANPAVLVADESVSALEEDLREEILALFAHLLRTRPLSLLFITHDLDLCRRYPHRTLQICDGLLTEFKF